MQGLSVGGGRALKSEDQALNVRARAKFAAAPRNQDRCDELPSAFCVPLK